MASNRPQKPFRVQHRRRQGKPTYASPSTRAKPSIRGRNRWHLQKVRGVASESCGLEKRRFCRDEKGRFKKGMKGCGPLKFQNVAVCRGIWGRFEGLEAVAKPFRHQQPSVRCREWALETSQSRGNPRLVDSLFRHCMDQLKSGSRPYFRPSREQAWG